MVNHVFEQLSEELVLLGTEPSIFSDAGDQLTYFVTGAKGWDWLNQLHPKALMVTDGSGTYKLHQQVDAAEEVIEYPVIVVVNMTTLADGSVRPLLMVTKVEEPYITKFTNTIKTRIKEKQSMSERKVLVLNIPANCTDPDAVIDQAIAAFNETNANGLLTDDGAKFLAEAIKRSKVIEANPDGGVVNYPFISSLVWDEAPFYPTPNTPVTPEFPKISDRGVHDETSYPDTYHIPNIAEVADRRGYGKHFLAMDDSAYLNNGDKEVADLNEAPKVDARIIDGDTIFTEYKTVPEYCALIRGWATDRNIIGGGSTPLDQVIKGLSEAGEIWDNIGKGNRELIKDDIGDIIVCIINSMGNFDLNLEDFLDDALLPDGSPTNQRLYQKRGLKRYSLQVLYTLAAYSKQLESVMDAAEDEGVIDAESMLLFMADEAANLVCVLDTIARAHDWTLAECLDQAYSDIKDRKGLMVSGTFVKEKNFTDAMVNAALADPNTKPATAAYLREWIMQQLADETQAMETTK